MLSLLWPLIRDKMPLCFSALQILIPLQVPSSVIVCFQVSEVEEEKGLRSMRMVGHLEAWKLCVQVGLLIAAQGYTSCCTSAFGTKRNKKDVENYFFFFLFTTTLPLISYQTKGTVLSYCEKYADGLGTSNCPMNHKHLSP